MKTQFKQEPEGKVRPTAQQRIHPFLWFNDNAEEAAHFYTKVFNRSAIKKVVRYGDEGPIVAGKPKGSVMAVDFEIEGYSFAAINGGPVFEITPSVSFFVNCDTVQEIDALWKKLSDGGTVMMELDTYPFSEKYGWIQDKFGVSWQLIFSGRKQKIVPCFMFSGEQHLKAEEAINFYISIFPDSEIVRLERYGSDVGPEGAIVHAKFTLEGQEFVAMDSHLPLPHNFNPALSFVVNCKTQDEVDYYWSELSEGGDEQAQQCGWLKDKFGLSWQVIPSLLIELLQDSDPVKSQRVMQAMLQMKKINLNGLQQAYDQK